MAGLLKSLFGMDKDSESSSDAGAGGDSPVSQEVELLQVTDETFADEVLASSLPVLVDFWAPWCGPCRMIAPIVEGLARAYHGKAVIAKMNTDENSRVASELGIMGIPTLILFKDGQEADRVVGYVPAKVLEEKLSLLLN